MDSRIVNVYLQPALVEHEYSSPFHLCSCGGIRSFTRRLGNNTSVH